MLSLLILLFPDFCCAFPPDAVIPWFLLCCPSCFQVFPIPVMLIPPEHLSQSHFPSSGEGICLGFVPGCLGIAAVGFGWVTPGSLPIYNPLVLSGLMWINVIKNSSINEWSLLIAGSWASPTISLDGSEASAAPGDQSQGEIWLCVESSAAQWIRCSENIPHPGEQNSGAHIKAAFLGPVIL